MNNKPRPTKKNENDEHYLHKEALLSPLQKLDSYYRKVLSQIDNFMTRELFVDSNVKILIGVSGGVDSVTLLDILANLSTERKWEIVVAHLDHNLRKESKNDVEFIEKLCDRYGVKLICSSKNIKKIAQQKKLSIEEAARRGRYIFFENTARSEKANFVATAHNSNDSAETFFLNLIRGSGLTGLSGIPQKRGLFKNINIIRPIIGLSKEEIINYAKKRDLEWVEDQSNLENRFDRNKIRNELIPSMNDMFGRDIVKTVNRAARIINSADRFIYSKLVGNIKDIVIERTKNYINIDARKLQLFEEFAQHELITIILSKYFNLFDIITSTVKSILNLTYSDPGSKFKINDFLTAYMDRSSLFIYKEVPIESINLEINPEGLFEFSDKSLKLSRVSKTIVELNDNQNVEFFDGDKLNGKLIIRNAVDGDKFMPLGMHGNMKLSDYMINRKIPLIKKREILVLTNDNEIVWVIGERISENYKVDEGTLRVVKAEISDI